MCLQLEATATTSTDVNKSKVVLEENKMVCALLEIVWPPWQ